ncbi:MAG: DUF1848 domain-containing protein [bacterium]|nr:DUF1848 domain-containing protein [bacterium]
MILSVSRRTDIPAFYGSWFLKRLEERFLLVRNPMNPKMVSRLDVNRELVDCIVFWTKNPAPMLPELHRLKDYSYYFLFTVTAYGKLLEKFLPPPERVMETFIKLSQKIGRERVIWRYDPIVMTDELDEAYHKRNFETIARRLENHTERCVISFLDMYEKCKRNLAGIPIRIPTETGMLETAGMLGDIAKKYGIDVVSCAEEMDLSQVGIEHGCCIDPLLVRRISRYPLIKTIKKNKGRRKACGCVESIDIGAYNTCPHICLYCYANSDENTVRRNCSMHNPDSPLLFGELNEGDRVVERKVESLREIQKNLFQ